MKTVVFLTLVGFFLQDSTAVIHSHKYFYTASSEVPDLPEFVTYVMVNDVQIDRKNSITRKMAPRHDFLDRATGEFLENLKERFNQTEGVHILQYMYGCDWDNETDEVINVDMRYGYNGEDFLDLDKKTFRFHSPLPQGRITKDMWNNDKHRLDYHESYLKEKCPDLLKKFMENWESFLMRQDLPTVSLLQKTPSSNITCHATGFYPSKAAVFWRKDGEELQDNVEYREILPNHDGSFQRSVDLELPADDWGRYECVFQFSGVKEDMVTKLDRKDIKTNHVKPVNPVLIVLSILAVVVLLATTGLLIYKRRNASSLTPPTNAEDIALKPVSSSARDTDH